MDNYTVILYLLIPLVLVLTTLWIPKNTCTKTIVRHNRNSILWSYWIIALIPILVHTLFWGLRDGVGTDWNAYKRIYEEARYVGYIEYEAGYVFINELFNKLGFDCTSIFLFTSFVNIFAVFFVSKKYDKITTVFLVLFFYLTSLVFTCQNGLRQMLAFSILFMTICLTDKKRGWIFILGGGTLSFIFHKSAVFPLTLLFLLYFSKSIYINKYLVVAIYLLFEIFGWNLQMSLYNLFAPLNILDQLDYSHFESQIIEANRTGVVTNSGIGIVIRTIMISLIILCQDIFYFKRKSPAYYYYIFFIIGAFLRPIFSGNNYLGRVNIYFSGMSVFVFAYLSVFLITHNKKKDYIISKKISNMTLFYILLVWCVFTYVNSFLNNSNGVFPYKMIQL